MKGNNEMTNQAERFLYDCTICKEEHETEWPFSGELHQLGMAQYAVSLLVELPCTNRPQEKAAYTRDDLHPLKT